MADRTATRDDDDVAHAPPEHGTLTEPERDAVAATVPPSGGATGASGGYGTGSGGEAALAEAAPESPPRPLHGAPEIQPLTSGGSGAGDEATSTAGDDTETAWLRDAAGGADR